MVPKLRAPLLRQLLPWAMVPRQALMGSLLLPVLTV